LEGTFRGHLAQPPCSEQGHLQLDQVAQSPIKPDLECFQGWGTSHLSGQPGCQAFTTLIAKNLFLIPSLTLSSFSLKPSPLVLLLLALLKSPSPAFLQVCFKYWKATIRSPADFSSPGSTDPTLSACPHSRGVPALRSLLWPPLDPVLLDGMNRPSRSCCRCAPS